jgi:PAS domain S-box-containing protein
MVIVSWLSIVLLGGVWIWHTYHEFGIRADVLRARHFEEKRALVREEVVKAVALIQERRHAAMLELLGDIAVRMDKAKAQARTLAALDPGLSDAAVRKAVADVLAAESGDGRKAVFTVRGDTVFLLDPVSADCETPEALDQLVGQLSGVVDGEQRLTIFHDLGERRSTLLVKVARLESPSMRIVSGACLEAVEAALKASVADQLGRISFGQGGYIFAGTWGGVSVVGPAKGQNMWDVVDANGVRLVRELVAAARRGGDYVTYVMPGISGQRQTKKISYAQAIPDWKWYVGAGVYVDDIEAVIARNRDALGHDIRFHLAIIVSALFFLGLLSLGLSRRVAGRIQRNIGSFTEAWSRASGKGSEVDPDDIHYLEFKRLAVAANRMDAARRAAELAMSEGVDRLGALVSNIPWVVYHSSVGKESAMLFVSDSVKEITGYPASDFVDNSIRSFASIMMPADAQWVFRAIEHDIRERLPFSIEYRIIRKDGEVRWLSEQGRARYDEHGVPQCLDGVIFDITDKKRVEEAHLNHLHFLETLERLDRDIRRTSDKDTMLSDVLTTVRRAFDADRSWLVTEADDAMTAFKVQCESLGNGVPSLITPGTPMPMDDEMSEVFFKVCNTSGPLALGGPKAMPVPHRVATAHGVKSELLVVIRPRMGDPWIMGLHQCGNAREWTQDEIRLFTEISRRVADALSTQLMHAELRESEEKFRTFSEQTMVGVCVVQDDRVVFANKAYCDIFEMSVDEMLALDTGGYVNLVHPDDRQFLLTQARKKQAGDADIVPSYTWRALTATGQVRWVEIHSRTVTLAGKLAVLVSLVDITEQKLAHDALETAVRDRTADLTRKAEELEAANRRLKNLDQLKSAFLTSVTHDLRTPMTSVLGFAKLIRKDLERALEEHGCTPETRPPVMDRIFKNVKIIENEGHRLAQVIDEFLTLSSLEDGTAAWEDRPLDARRCVLNAVERTMTRSAAGHEVRVVHELAEDIPTVLFDQGRFELLLDNLLDNAVKHVPDGGTITIRLSGGERGGLILSVSDTGSGIPVEEQSAIFNAFHQIESGDTLLDVDKGTGLGLALCKGIVARYHGRIRVESEPGKGSTFFVELPGEPPRQG